MSLIYPTDYRGYDGLLTVADIFPTYDSFKEQMNDYMFSNQIGTLEDEDENETLDKKIFNVFFNRYKNHYFRFRSGATILTKLAREFERLYQEYDSIKVLASTENLTGTTTTNKDYKTNNGAEGVITKYQIDESTSSTDDSRLYIDYVNGRINRSSFITDRIDDMKKLFMNKTNEVVIKEGILTK